MKINLYSCNFRSEHFLETNYQIFKQLNPDIDFKWIICNQSPDKNVIINHDEYVVFHRENDLKGTSTTSHMVGHASLSHGNGLKFIINDHKSLYRNDVDFHLVIDPDFYILRPLTEILTDKQITGFGYPNSSRHAPMMFGFPTLFCSIFSNDTDFFDMDFGSDFHRIKKLPNGFRPDTGYKIILDMMKGKYLYHTYTKNIFYHKYFSDIYLEDNNSILSIHIHTRVNATTDLLIKSHNCLSDLDNVLGDFKTKYRIDFGFLNNIKNMATELTRRSLIEIHNK